MKKKQYAAPLIKCEIIYDNDVCEWLDNSHGVDAGDSDAKRSFFEDFGFEGEEQDDSDEV